MRNKNEDEQTEKAEIRRTDFLAAGDTGKVNNTPWHTHAEKMEHLKVLSSRQNGS